MPVVRNLSGKQLGEKTRELIELVEQTLNWEEYVSEDCQVLIKTLIKNKNMTNTLEELDIKYPTARARIIRSIDRIKSKNTSFMRNARSEIAQELISLTEKNGWENNLTAYEVILVKEFKQLKNLYATGRKLNIKPSNVYGMLYGNSQKQGILNKIKKEKTC